MNTDIIGIVVCLVLPAILQIIVAIIAINHHHQAARKIFRGIKEGRFDDFSTGYRARRIRFFSIVGLLSIIGMIATFILVIRQYIALSSIYTALIFILFLSSGSIAGIFLSREVSERLK